ncbi:DUF4148 domain-containing protein [Edaphosphingomonas haloaromaticamans]|uniref:EF hand n=1 Tax=Edaphosphingomonas haloaromaticamans TaxID=653954 RepID=A0A1S1HLC3_9SPHN|nr:MULTISPECIES: DUF4148 domain-containing protein [Sphingomonas]MDX3884103.1 DUF4148 domain-containing protein [Sphingomonas sp.]OHT22231.1 EF hand [Sphingomonas haloaromaticamans]
MKKFVIGASLAALVAVPALAFQDAPRAPKAPQTRAEVQAQVAEHFARMDLNKDGFVTQEEIKAGREARAKARADQRFAALDSDKNGQISRAEWDAGREHAKERFAERRGGDHGPGKGRGMRGHHRMGGHGWGGQGAGGWGDRMFAMADANKDGKVSLAEATAARLAWFDRIDTNKDGTISPEERKAAFDQMRAQRADRKAPPAGN